MKSVYRWTDLFGSGGGSRLGLLLLIA